MVSLFIFLTACYQCLAAGIDVSSVALKTIDCDATEKNFLVGPNIGCKSIRRYNEIYNQIKDIAPLSAQALQVTIENGNGMEMALYSNKLELREKDRLQKYQDWTWIHETGHLVFYNLIKNDFPDLSCAFSKDTIESNSQKCTEVERFLSGYNELFADFVLVLLTSDLKATSAGDWDPPFYLKFDNPNITTCEKSAFFGHYDYSIARYTIG